MSSANPTGFLKFLLHHWAKTLILLMVVAVFAAAPLVMLYNATLGRLFGQRGGATGA